MSLALFTFIVIILLGIAGNAKAYKANAFAGWHVWFWNIVWVLALKATWVPLT